jgi:hypothetical protein
MIHSAGAGPKPIPQKELTADNLSEAIKFCLDLETVAAAQNIASDMGRESGVREAVKSFHSNLPLESLPCDLIPDQPASWLHKTKGKTFRLSKIAAEILVADLKIEPTKMNMSV